MGGREISFLYGKVMKLHFTVLTFNLFDLNYLKTFETSLLRVVDMVLAEKFLNLLVRAVSSANRVNLKKS